MVLQNHIHTYEDRGHKKADQSPMSFREFLALFFPAMRGQPLPLVPPGPLPQYQARINWGRWIVDCLHCNSALDVTPTETQGICLDCGTEWFEIVFPSTPIKQGIETALLKRPGKRGGLFPNSNWDPGQAVADLHRDNQRMGIN